MKVITDENGTIMLSTVQGRWTGLEDGSIGYENRPERMIHIRNGELYVPSNTVDTHEIRQLIDLLEGQLKLTVDAKEIVRENKDLRGKVEALTVDNLSLHAERAPSRPSAAHYAAKVTAANRDVSAWRLAAWIGNVALITSIVFAVILDRPFSAFAVLVGLGILTGLGFVPKYLNRAKNKSDQARVEESDAADQRAAQYLREYDSKPLES